MASSSVRSEDCKRLLFEAVNENSVSKFKQVKSSYNRNELLASLAQRNETDETPLGIAMKRKHFDLIDELVMCLQNCYRLTGNCHVLSKIVIEQLSHQVPIVELIDHLKKEYDGISPTSWSKFQKFIEQIFIESTSFPRQDKIIALELIGAYSMMHIPHSGLYCNVIDEMRCWRVAMALRFSPPEGEPLLPKIPDVLVSSEASSVVFGSAAEVTSMEELNLLEEYFVNNCYDVECRNLMDRQALLVIRRICNQANHGQPNWIYLNCLYWHGRLSMCKIDFHYQHLNYSLDSKISINTFLFILEQTSGIDPKMLSRKSFKVLINTLDGMSHYFYIMVRESVYRPENNISYADLLAPTKFIAMISKFCPKPSTITSILHQSPSLGAYYFSELVFYLVFVLDAISPQLSSQEKQQLEVYYSNYIRYLFPERTSSVLHAAVNDIVEFDYTLLPHFDYLNLIKLILKLGADPNAIDEYGQTPLHILTENIGLHHLDENFPVFQALVNAGSHLDVAADNGDTVISMLKAKMMPWKENDVIVSPIVDPYYDSLINTVLPLSCYCAQVIGKHGIRFDEDRLPLHLQTFVARHSAIGSGDLHEHDVFHLRDFDFFNFF